MMNLRNVIASLHPVVNVLLIGSMISRVATSMSLPFLAIFLVTHTEMSPWMIGLTVGLGPLASTLTGFVGGAISDRIGRKIVMLSAIYVWGAVFIGFAIGEGYLVFMLLSFLNGVCKAFFEPVSQALMGDLTEKGLRYRMFSLRYIAVNIGFAVGPMLGAIFGVVGGTTPFIVTGCIFLFYAVLLTILLNRYGIRSMVMQTHKIDHLSISIAAQIISRDRVLLAFIAGGILMQVVYAQLTTLSNYLADDFVDGAKLYAWLMTTNAIVVVLTQLPLSAWAEKKTPLTGILWGNGLYALGGLGFAFSDSWVTMILSMVIFTLGEVLCFPAGSIMIDKIAPDGLRGTYYGAQNLKELGRFMGPPIGLFIVSAYGIVPLFIGAAVVALASSYFYWLGERRYSSKPFAPIQGGRVNQV